MSVTRRFVKVDASDPKPRAQTRALIRLLYNVHSRKSPLYQIRCSSTKPERCSARLKHI
jgi:hypothetical protein